MQLAVRVEEPPIEMEVGDAVRVQLGTADAVTVIVAAADCVPTPLALFAVTVTPYVVAVGRLAAGMVQVDVVQPAIVVPFSLQT